MAKLDASFCCLVALVVPPILSRCEAHGDTVSVVVSVVDLAARVVHCHLLPAPAPSPPYSSRTSTSRHQVVTSQVTRLLEELLWWRNGDAAVAFWDIASDSELQARVVGAIEKVVSRVEILQIPLQRDAKEYPTIPDEALQRVSCLLKRPDVLLSWRTEFPAQFGWFLLELHEIFSANLMLDEAKYEGAFELELHTDAISTHMRLNPAAKLAFASSNPHQPSLLKMISPFCCTKAGRVRLAQMIARPCVDVDILQQRHQLVSALLSMSSRGHTSTLWRAVSALLSHFRSFDAQIEVFIAQRKRTRVKPLSLQDFEHLQLWLTQVPTLLAQGDSAPMSGDEKFVEASFFAPLKEIWRAHLAAFCKTIGDLTTMSQNPESPVSERIQRAVQLHELCDQIKQCETDIESVKQQTAGILRLPSGRIKVVFDDDNAASLRGLQVLLRVSRQDSHRVHQHNGALVTVQRTSKASGVLFSTSELDRLSAAWRALKLRYQEIEDILVNELTEILRSEVAATLVQLVQVVAELDVLVSFAGVSREKGFACPKLVNSKDGDDGWSIQIVSPFDPFREKSFGDTDREQRKQTLLPPQEIRLSRKEEKTFLLLAGSDAEANNCVLHTIGLVATLNQIGCFVPCSAAKLPVFDAMFVRTGVYDEQFFGHSTFMTEMIEMAMIFRFATSSSLVLINDLCRGTSNAEGLALALSICQHLMDLRAAVCFTTEWRELADGLKSLPATEVSQYLLASSSQARINDGSNRFVRTRSFGSTVMKLTLAEIICSDSTTFDEIMVRFEFPVELLQLIRSELQPPPPENDSG